MTWSAYPEYKDSGIAWLMQIPTNWEIGKFRHCFRESSEKNGKVPVGPMLSVSGYRGVEVKHYDDDNQRRTVEQLEDYRVVRAGQLAVNTMWLNYAGLGVSEFEGHISPAYRSYWIGGGFDKRYIHHLMRSGAYVDGYTALLTGIRPNSLQMGREDLMAFPVLRPPLPEQRTIAKFLDKETAKIDALIGKQERLIATLREDRTATITHAVTKGLDPDAEMQDSGNAWTGFIPKHWDAVPMKRGATRITDGAHVSPDTQGGVYDFVSTKDVSDTGIDFAGSLKTTPASYEYLVHNGCKPEVGDVLFSKDGTVGRTVVVTEAREFVVASSLIIIKCDSQVMNPWFAHYACQSANIKQQVDSFVKGAGLPRLSISNLRKVVVARPPMNEQLEIVDFLNRRCSKVDTLIAKATGVIDTLLEYRSALITDAVTGKIDVRGAA